MSKYSKITNDSKWIYDSKWQFNQNCKGLNITNYSTLWMTQNEKVQHEKWLKKTNDSKWQMAQNDK